MSTHPSRRDSSDAVDILLVEDNPGDVRLTEEAFEAADSEAELRAVTDGDDAVEHLLERAADPSRSLPDLALVDLNLPGRDGCELIEAIRGDARLELLPVIVLTSSADSDDVERCYHAHANAYLTKPSDPDEFGSLAEAVESFWFERARLPPLSR